MPTGNVENNGWFQGWFPLPRSLFAGKYSPITLGRPFTELEALIWLLARANYAERRARDVTVKPGQVLTSEGALSREWQWNPIRVRRFLVDLEKSGWIERHPSKRHTLITIRDVCSNKCSKVCSDERSDKILVFKPKNEGVCSNECSEVCSEGCSYKNNNKKNKYIYTPIFEAFWSVYPRKVEKRRAFKAWKARLREGYNPEDMILAAKNYALAVKGREPEYIKHPATFLGPSLPFEEYVNRRPPQKQCINTAMPLSGRSLGTLRQCGCEECSAELERRMREGGGGPSLLKEDAWELPRKKCFNVGLALSDRSIGMLEGCGCEECLAELERRRKENDDDSEA